MYYNKINGNRIYLSPMNIDDIDKYLTWLSDENVARGINALSKMYNSENEREFILDTLKKGKYNFAIIKKEDNSLIGNCGIMDIDNIHNKATLGIFIGDEENRNKGYGTEVLKLLIDYGFNILNLNNIDLKVFSFNERAIACYKKCGLVEYGRRHESYYINNKYYDEIYMEILRNNYYKNK